jgi:hypothetical protein
MKISGTSGEERIRNEEYCELEQELYNELSDDEEIVNHWSFLRHDPSKPLQITENITPSIEDDQDSNPIRILTKNHEVENLLQRGSSILRNLTSHHRVLLAYYHQDEEIRKKIREMATQKFENR